MKLVGSIIFSLCLCLTSCSTSKNNKLAFGYEENGQAYLKLKDKLSYMVHDPISLLSNKKYWDSLILPIPSLNEKRIEGKSIPIQKGYYSFVGEITFANNIATVNLIIDDTDSKIQRPCSWNGIYKFQNLVNNK